MTYPTELIDKIAELVEELTPQYGSAAAVPDWRILEILDVADPALPPRMTPVPARFIRNTLMAQPTLDWGKLRIASESSNPNQDLRALAITALEVLTEASDSDVDFTDPNVANLFNSVVETLVTAGIVNPAVPPIIEAAAATPQSWSEMTGIPVTPAAIAAIRAGS